MHHGRLAFLAAMIIAVASPAAGADLPLGARCANSNQCATKRCSADVCKTYKGTLTYFPDGESCRMSGDCASNKCVNSICGGPKKPAAVSKPLGGSTTPRTPTNARSTRGETSIKEEVPDGATECEKDLVNNEYCTNRISAWSDAGVVCSSYKQAFIDQIKKMQDSGQGRFENILEVMVGTPEQIRCANDEYKRLSADDKKKLGLRLSDVCRGRPTPVGPKGSAAGLACAKDLRAGGYIPNGEDAQWDAENVCEEHSQVAINQAKKLYRELPYDSISIILSEISSSTPAQIECAKTTFQKLSPAEKARAGFSMPATCKPKAPYQK